jgi:hypothetical protein
VGVKFGARGRRYHHKEDQRHLLKKFRLEARRIAAKQRKDAQYRPGSTA